MASAIISAITQASVDSTKSNEDNKPKTNDQAGVQFGGREEAASKKQHERGRKVSPVKSGIRRVTMGVSSTNTSHLTHTVSHGDCELDTHANTCVLGANFIPLQYTGRTCEVHPYLSEYQAIPNIPIITGATAVTSQETGEVFILAINEALYFGDRMDHSLINPNQLRHYEIEVQHNPFDLNHQLVIQTISKSDSEVVIPLTTKGTTILFEP